MQLKRFMYDEHETPDDQLIRLGQSLRRGEHMLACLQLAEFALKLDHCIHLEERTLSLTFERRPMPNPLTKVRREHASLRRLISSIAAALDRADDRRGLELVGKLRSVLIVHLVKEETLYPMLSAN